MAVAVVTMLATHSIRPPAIQNADSDLDAAAADSKLPPVTYTDPLLGQTGDVDSGEMLNETLSLDEQTVRYQTRKIRRLKNSATIAFSGVKEKFGPEAGNRRRRIMAVARVENAVLDAEDLQAAESMLAEFHSESESAVRQLQAENLDHNADSYQNLLAIYQRTCEISGIEPKFDHKTLQQMSTDAEKRLTGGNSNF